MQFNKVLVFLLLLCMLSGNALYAKEYKVAVRAHHGIDHARKQWQSTLDLLTHSLPPHRFTMVPVLGLDEITQMAGRGEYDFLLTNPSSFVEIAYLYKAKALATLNNRRANTAQTRFGSVIFTHVMNEDIVGLKDLQGKTMMAASEAAFGGWRVAWLEMLEQGFDPYDQLKSLQFTRSKTQPEVVMAVLGGKVDAGVVRTDRLERMETAGKIDMRYLRIINNKDEKDFPFFLSTKLYPEWPFAVLKSVPDEFSQQVKSILLNISEDSAAARSGGYVGWVEPRDYRTVKDLMKTLKVGPYSNHIHSVKE